LDLSLNPFKHIICFKSIHIGCLYVLLLLFSSFQTFSQLKNEDELKKQANILFEEEDYNQAYKSYSQLVSLYPKDPEYNYRLAVCMLFTEPDKKKPFTYFQIALKNPAEAPKDAKFYLAKTYHVNYKFDEAIKLYTEYKQTASAASVKKLQVDREIAACKNGKRLLSNLSDLVVISKKQLNEADYFRSYDIKDIGGKLLVKPEDFKTATDKKKKDKSVVYLPRNGERVYFSSYGDGGNGRDIFFVNRLPNGSWSKAQPMPSPINTEYDEDYPFLHPNGKTLYFSSKGHNSMGGYDVFKTTYNTETQTWSKPENLDFPINSPDDDILFVTDSLEKTAFFSTGRYSPYGKIDVLKINTERRPMNFAVLKGTVLKESVAQSVLAKISVKNMANGEIVGTYQAQENGDYYMELPNGGKFIFTVETPGLTTQSDGVQMPIAYSLKPYKQAISYENKVLKIINYFDGQIADENYSMMIDLIEKKAKLEVNENDPYNNNLKDGSKNNNTNASATNTGTNSVSTTNPTAQGNTDGNGKTNTNKNVTNEQLMSIAKMDAVEAESESKTLKKEAQEAFDLATQKTAEATAIQKQADDAAANLTAITDITKQNEETVKINQLKEDAKIATAVANTATNLAKKLEMDANQKKQEAELTNQYITELDAITKNKNNKEALAKLEQIQKQLDDISKQKNQSDELVSSIKAELELKQNELKKSENKTNEIVNEINLIKSEAGSLETDLANENDKSLKENISAQIRELNTDVDQKSKELNNNNLKIASLQNQVDGLNQEMAIASKILNDDGNGTAINTTKNNTTDSGTNITDNNQNTGSQNSNQSYEGITSKYNSQVKGDQIDTSNKEELGTQNTILKNYNKEIGDLIAIDKNQLSKTKNDAEKKKLTTEIKELEKQKTKNDQLITGNTTVLKKLDSSAIATTTAKTSNTTSIDPGTDTGNDTASKTNTISATETNTTTETAIASNTTQGNSTGIDPINTSAAGNTPAYLDELNKLKNNLAVNSGQATAVFDYNTYKEPGSLTLKQAADKKFETAKQNEASLTALVAKTETDIKSNSGNNADVLLNEAEALNTKAFEQRKESVSKSGTEKDELVKQATENEKLAVNKKLEAADLQEKQNKTKFDVNTTNLSELQKLTGSKTSNDISQANLLADEAAVNYKQAQKIRDEANAYPSGAAKLGGLGNADEKENEALAKQQKALELLLKTNPSYKIKTPAGGADPSASIAALNNEVTKTSQSQLDAYTALSKANQNEFKLQNDKLAKTGTTNKQALDLKKESENLNKEALAFTGQSSKAGSVSEKAALLLKANETEIEALKKQNEASALVANSGSDIATTDANTASGTNAKTNTNSSENTTDPNTNSGTTTAKTNNSTTGNTTDPNNNSGTTTANTTTGTTGNTADPNNNNGTTTAKTNNTTTENTNTVTTSGSETTAAVKTNTATENSGVQTNSTTSTSGTDPGTAITSNTTAPVSTDINSDATNLQAGLNNATEGNLTGFNTYNDAEAIALKEKAAEKINAALTEDKNISASLDNVKQLASSSPSQGLSQENINSSVTEAEKMNDEAYELRKSSATKTGEEKEKDLQQAKELETKAIAKKIEAADNQKQLNAATFDANNQSLEELAAMAKGKNISELGTANMQQSEAALYFTQAKKLREETNAYPTDAAKLGGLSNAEEKEAWALSKQKALLETYKKYFSNYTPKAVNAMPQNPEATAKLNETKTTLNTNNQLHIDGLVLLSQAIDKEYKSRLTGLPATLKANDQALKTKAQDLYKKYQAGIVQANKTTDLNKKKDLLVKANKDGQDAINLLNQINTSGNAAVANNTSGNTNSGNTNSGNTTTGNTNSGNTTTGNAGNTNTAATNTTTGTAGNTSSSNKNNTAGSTTNNTKSNTANTSGNTNTIKLKVEGLEVKTNNAYTDNKPIPLDEKIPDGLVFKVQIGAFKTALPNNTFKGLSPVIAQTTPSGYIRYMAGNFEKYESANAVKNDLKNLGYSDAFVVVYYNGKRINLNEGVAKAQESGQKVDLATAANTSAGITASSNVPRNTAPTTANTTVTGDSSPADITNELEKMNGLLYTVQIGVYSKQVTKSQLSNLRPIYTEKLPSGLYRYTAGIYNQSSKLLEDKRKVVDLGVKDAFVSAYFNAKRIPFAEGQKLQTENNNLKMEAENPIIFPGAGTVLPTNTATVPANTTAPANNTPNPTVTAFSNGITQGPAATADNGVKTDEAGISFKVQIGAYKNQVPNEVASKFMNIKTWPVNNVVINGLYLYTIGNFNAPGFAKKLKDEVVALGITDAFVTVYKDGKKLYGAEAVQYLNK
jgi:hypothetical protein